MSDYNEELSELHHRVWQDRLMAPATINELGWVEFGDVPIGRLSIILREHKPEGMELSCRIFADYTENAPSPDDLIRICNSINRMKDAKLRVNDPHSEVYASIYLLLTAPGYLPDEELLAAIVLPAVTRIKDAKTAFLTELEKLNIAPTG